MWFSTSILVPTNFFPARNGHQQITPKTPSDHPEPFFGGGGKTWSILSPFISFVPKNGSKCPHKPEIMKNKFVRNSGWPFLPFSVQKGSQRGQKLHISGGAGIWTPVLLLSDKAFQEPYFCSRKNVHQFPAIFDFLKKPPFSGPYQTPEKFPNWNSRLSTHFFA